MKSKKTFEIQMLMHIDAETKEEAVQTFLANLEMVDFVDKHSLGGDFTLDVRDVNTDEDAVDVKDFLAKVHADSPYNDGWIKEFYKKVDDENK
jgi:hypothetical protein|tara:strand:+ start:387 stop:665 length:279 start_codon:yes stop_codon:yes gene_type:complete